MGAAVLRRHDNGRTAWSIMPTLVFVDEVMYGARFCTPRVLTYVPQVPRHAGTPQRRPIAVGSRLGRHQKSGHGQRPPYQIRGMCPLLSYRAIATDAPSGRSV